jgi:hypothetical protein
MASVFLNFKYVCFKLQDELVERSRLRSAFLWCIETNMQLSASIAGQAVHMMAVLIVKSWQVSLSFAFQFRFFT